MEEKICTTECWVDDALGISAIPALPTAMRRPPVLSKAPQQPRHLVARRTIDRNVSPVQVDWAIRVDPVAHRVDVDIASSSSLVVGYGSAEPLTSPVATILQSFDTMRIVPSRNVSTAPSIPS